jgi:catechol 2,3-dioxygenase-like lactoylglutathione lyase family enzyme
MQPASRADSDSAVAVTDGYVGLNVNLRKPGRPGAFDHFGIEVDDVDRIQARVQQRYPTVTLLRRPGNRPFAGISLHDPAGNVFDLSHKAMENRRGIYTDLGEASGRHPRYVSHFQLRAVEPARLAQFYCDVFDFEETPRSADDPNTYLSDGTITMVIVPWRIADYEGTGIERPALDHLGFRVESLEQFEADLQRVADRNPLIAPLPIGRGPEGQRRLELFQRCPLGKYHLADPDGVLIDVSEA